MFDIFPLSYVDSYRSVSTELGGTKQDLKDKMASMNSSGFDAASCCSDELMYLRQVKQILRCYFRCYNNV